jgi:hypothetical protein
VVRTAQSQEYRAWVRSRCCLQCARGVIRRDDVAVVVGILAGGGVDRAVEVCGAGTARVKLYAAERAPCLRWADYNLGL